MDVLAQLSRAFDYVLMDAPGTHVSSDAESLGSVADAAVLVIDAHKTRRAATAEAKERLDMAGVRLLGNRAQQSHLPDSREALSVALSSWEREHWLWRVSRLDNGSNDPTETRYLGF